MARKKDTRTVKAVGSKKPKATRTTKKAPEAEATPRAPKAAAKSAAKSAAKKVGKAAETIAAKAPANGRRAASPSVRTAVSKATSAPEAGKKALKAARVQARALLADLPSAPLPDKVNDSVKAIGNQITAWLDTDLGRMMVAELLVYVARQLTATAERVDGGKGAKEAVLRAGAEIGAAAIDAGAQMVKAGRSVAGGEKAAASPPPQTADILRSVTQAAVGAMGEVVAGVAQKAIERRSGGAPEKGGKKKR